MKKFISVLLVVAMCLGLTGTAFAQKASSEGAKATSTDSAEATSTDSTEAASSEGAEATSTDSSKKKSESETDSKSKDELRNSEFASDKGGSVFVEDAPHVDCCSAIVMEAKTGTILYGKKDLMKRYPASITKLLTSLVAVENSQMDDTVKITKNCVSWLKWDEASLGVEAGNELTMEQALYAVLLKSANEVAYAVGESTGKNLGYDYDWFIDQMNAKVDELGGQNSNFVNTNGLHKDKHYTCANDMALIAREIFNYPELLKIMQTKTYSLKKSKKINENYKFTQHHKMLLKNSSYYYKYVVGGKTGYTKKAEATLVTMAEKGDMQLVCVMLKGNGVKNYKDTKKLLKWAFKNFKVEDISKQATLYGQGTSDEYDSIYTGEETAEKYADDKDVLRNDSGYVVLPKDAEFDELEETDEGTLDDGNLILSYSLDGLTVGKAIAQPKQSFLEKLMNGGDDESDASQDDANQSDASQSDTSQGDASQSDASQNGESSNGSGNGKTPGKVSHDVIGGFGDLLYHLIEMLQNA